MQLALPEGVFQPLRTKIRSQNANTTPSMLIFSSKGFEITLTTNENTSLLLFLCQRQR